MVAAAALPALENVTAALQDLADQVTSAVAEKTEQLAVQSQALATLKVQATSLETDNARLKNDNTRLLETQKQLHESKKRILEDNERLENINLELETKVQQQQQQGNETSAVVSPPSKRTRSAGDSSNSSAESSNLLRTLRAQKLALVRELQTERDRVAQLKDEIEAAKKQDRVFPNIIMNHWNREGCSPTVRFTSDASFRVQCIDEDHDYGASMPGVHATIPFERGVYRQEISLEGSGYTLVGLVASDEEKTTLRLAEDWGKLPSMTGAGFEGQIITIDVDMNERKATLRGRDLEHVYENLPSKVWVACALKRNTERKAILMPCLHWDN